MSHEKHASQQSASPHPLRGTDVQSHDQYDYAVVRTRPEVRQVSFQRSLKLRLYDRDFFYAYISVRQTF